MPLCPTCQQPASKRNGRDPPGRWKYACRSCRRTFSQNSTSVFSGYRWPADVILTGVRWYLAYPPSSRQVLELLAERGIDVSHRTLLDWVQAFGSRHARDLARTCACDHLRSHPLLIPWPIGAFGVFPCALGTLFSALLVLNPSIGGAALIQTVSASARHATAGKRRTLHQSTPPRGVPDPISIRAWPVLLMALNGSRCGNYARSWISYQTTQWSKQAHLATW